VGDHMTEPKTNPHSRNLRLHRQMEGPGTFFVTKCLQPRKPLIDDVVAPEICSANCFYAEKKQVYLGAFVVMRDHWHVLLATRDGKTLSQRVKLMGTWINRQTGQRLSEQGCAWQDGFHETWTRSTRQFLYICGYIEENPVRAGLVKNPSEWKWSSARPEYRRYLTKPWPWRFEKA
jgi:REP element-mobilizing transposase RayT